MVTIHNVRRTSEPDFAKENVIDRSQETIFLLVESYSCIRTEELPVQDMCIDNTRNATRYVEPN